MRFFDKLLIKQNFKCDLNNMDFICEKATECLDPLVEVYILYYIYGNIENKPNNPNDIKLSLNALSLYLERLNSMQRSLNAQFKENSKLLKRYENKYEEVLKNIKKLHSDIFSLDVEIRGVESYENIDILVKSLGYLSKLECQININNGKTPDVAVGPRECINA